MFVEVPEDEATERNRLNVTTNFSMDRTVLAA